MKTPASIVALLILAVMIAACAEVQSEASAGSEDEVRAASVAWDEAFNAGNLAALMDLYADDAVSMPYYRPPIEGKAAIEEDFEGFFGDFDAYHETTIVGLAVAGDWAIERGAYILRATPHDGSESFEEDGKHIVVRRRAADGWKVVWEIWNLNGEEDAAASAVPALTFTGRDCIYAGPTTFSRGIHDVTVTNEAAVDVAALVLDVSGSDLDTVVLGLPALTSTLGEFPPDRTYAWEQAHAGEQATMTVGFVDPGEFGIACLPFDGSAAIGAVAVTVEAAPSD